jgi:hypothetical protein
MPPGYDKRLQELSVKDGYPEYLAGCKYAGNYTPPASGSVERNER